MEIECSQALWSGGVHNTVKGLRGLFPAREVGQISECQPTEHFRESDNAIGFAFQKKSFITWAGGGIFRGVPMSAKMFWMDCSWWTHMDQNTKCELITALAHK